MQHYKIIMTGGGSAGHVTPNLALIPKLKSLGYEVKYIGSKDGIEKEIIKNSGIPYYSISSGKLRRYFDIKNFSDPFKVIKGIFEAIEIMKREKPDVVFSKGGFVSVPVVIAAHFNKIPVVAHESDMTPGLANKLSAPYCTKLCLTFPESLEQVKKEKGVLTGTPIREELFRGNSKKALEFCNLTGDKPILLVIGGSLGSKFINDNLRAELEEILKNYDVIHICGKDNIDKKLESKKGYRQYEFLSEELPDLLKASDIVLSRAGANVIYELLALKKPNLLIPLSKKSSRGDQILNASSFERSGYSMVIQEEDIEKGVLPKKIKELYENRKKYIEHMEKSPVKNAVENITRIIVENTKSK
ncbi:undecaprenyldiphospho-muramoylpentapeptide beta-N-acetylglucosaminyltransferase [Clostridium amazonitimonense]|uniref:undecaprenyldiphospho-muramoylpentapeptide beta-N-acetylglucosaminyltransferase n=1 Tax=Clostridium amazonitimonense TaxID=1499689 RepID=UPI000A72968A|nr:undecaprenyldiphospho-muramoylpentapeptide beta-N-acetylglucosaminyltransferase [Clostridium amazonitimonense]